MVRILNFNSENQRPWFLTLILEHRVFHKIDEIGNNANKGFTTWKQKTQWQNITYSEDWTRASD